jgi:hypothetical protein
MVGLEVIFETPMGVMVGLKMTVGMYVSVTRVGEMIEMETRAVTDEVMERV